MYAPMSSAFSTALLLRAGFVLIQIGCVPTDNVCIILLQNIVDLIVACLSFGLLGFQFAYGKNSAHRALGYGSWISSEYAELDNGVHGK